MNYKETEYEVINEKQEGDILYLALKKQKEEEVEATTLKNKVILNIGHGNTISGGKAVYDPGAVGNGIEEHQWNKDFVNNYIVPECKKQGVPYEVIIQSKNFSGLAGEINKISTKDDVIVSFHLNSATATATGVETFYYPTSVKGKELAQLMLDANLKATGLRSRGIKPNNSGDRGHALFQGTKGVVTLLETGFVSNETDMKVLETCKQGLAVNYVAAIKEYLTKYN